MSLVFKLQLQWQPSHNPFEACLRVKTWFRVKVRINFLQTFFQVTVRLLVGIVKVILRAYAMYYVNECSHKASFSNIPGCFHFCV